jgi:hypothetical protein
MLTHLQIRDFAIVEAVELEFGSGFTVLTGETGAGKSILIDALLLAVGGRADSGAVRHGAERAEVSATFALAGNAAALAWLDEQSIEHEGECQLRRVVGADGRGRAYLNGLTVPVQSLRALGELLVDVHGQLEFQSLSRRGYQRATLDGSGQLAARNAAVRTAHAAWQALDDQRASFEQRVRERESRLDLLRHFVTELQALDPGPGEAEAVTEERKRISSLGRLAEGTAQVEALLAGDDGGVTSALARSQGVLRQLAASMRRLSPWRRSSRRRRLPRAKRFRACAVTPMRSMPILRDRNGSKRDLQRSKPLHANTASKHAGCQPCATHSLPSSPNSMPAWSAKRNCSNDSLRLASATLPPRNSSPRDDGGDRAGPQGHRLHAGAGHAGRRVHDAGRAAGSAGVLGAW